MKIFVILYNDYLLNHLKIETILSTIKRIFPNFLHFIFWIKLNIIVSLSVFQPEIESPEKGKINPIIIPYFNSNKFNVGPLLSHNSW